MGIRWEETIDGVETDEIDPALYADADGRAHLVVAAADLSSIDLAAVELEDVPDGAEPPPGHPGKNLRRHHRPLRTLPTARSPAPSVGPT